MTDEAEPINPGPETLENLRIGIGLLSEQLNLIHLPFPQNMDRVMQQARELIAEYGGERVVEGLICTSTFFMGLVEEQARISPSAVLQYIATLAAESERNPPTESGK